MSKRPAGQEHMGCAVAVVFAGGRSLRMGYGIDKMTIDCAGKPLVRWVVDRLLRVNLVQKVIVSANQENAPQLQETLALSESCQLHSCASVRGTAYNLFNLRRVLKNFKGSILTVDGDLVLIRQQTLETLIQAHLRSSSVATVLVFRPTQYDQCVGYERLPYPLNQNVVASDVMWSPITPCLVGAMCFQWPVILPHLQHLIREDRDEYRLCELPGRLLNEPSEQNVVQTLFLDDVREARSVNTPQALQECEKLLERVESWG